VTATPPVGPPLTSAPSTATVAAAQSPAISVLKSASPASIATVGQMITDTFVVTNGGNVTLSNIGVVDNQSAPAGVLTTSPSCVALLAPIATCSGGTTTLGAGQVATFTANYIVTQADLDQGSVHDAAVASGTPAGSNAVISSASNAGGASSATTPATVMPALSLRKSASVALVATGDSTVTYDFLVTNTGNVTLSALSVADTQSAPATQANLSAVICPTSSLAPGASEHCSATYTVTQADRQHGSLNDSATATGVPSNATAPISSNASAVNLPMQQAATPSADPPLAFTGAELLGTVGAGAILVALGFGLVVLSTRRRKRTSA
jgi:uncharacterized repeat protein (TIGR01451 family)